MRKEIQIKREQPRQPGKRRVLDALKAIKEERPGLVEKATLAAGALAKRRGGGGQIPQ